jgi:integrase
MPYKRGQKWIAQVRKEAQRLEKVFLSKKEAKDWEAKMRRKPVEEWNEKTAMVCLGDWAQAYLDVARVRFAKTTYHEKKVMFKRFLKLIDPAMPVSALKPAHVQDYIIKQKEERSGYAANKDRKNLVAAWNWGIKYMDPVLPAPNPCMVERMPETRHPRYIPPEKDFWAVYGVANDQDQCMLLCFLHLAARRGEIFRLTWEDVDFVGSMVRLATRKRRGGSLEYNWLPMTDDLFTELLAHRHDSDSEWVFENPKTGEAYVNRKRWMKALCTKAGVKTFGVHAIRHLTASILAKEGIPAVQIQNILRHKKLSTTELYLHQMGDLKAALNVLTNKSKKPSSKPSAPKSAETKIRLVS